MQHELEHEERVAIVIEVETYIVRVGNDLEVYSNNCGCSLKFRLPERLMLLRKSDQVLHGINPPSANFWHAVQSRGVESVDFPRPEAFDEGGGVRLRDEIFLSAFPSRGYPA